MNENIKILVSVIIGSIVGGCIVYVIMTNYMVMNDSKITNIVNFDFDAPETFDEVMTDLIIVGCDTIIPLHMIFSSYNVIWISYNDALKLASQAKAVYIPVASEGQGFGFSFKLDGEWWGWIR